jgi:hypothetical protein
MALWGGKSTNNKKLIAALKGEIVTQAAMTIYCATTGSDTTGDGSAGLPFKTPQKAYDELPFLVGFGANYDIKLADGIYNDNYLGAGAMPRPAILFTSGKWLRSRTDRSGGSLVGAVVIKGNSATPGNVVIKCTSAFTYGIYNGQGQLCVEDLHIEGDGVNATTALMVSHRNDSYIHCNNVTLNGVDKANTSYGAYAESGGQLEMTGTGDFKNCATAIGALTAGDTVTISDDINVFDNDYGVAAKRGGCVSLQNTNGLARGIKLYNNSLADILSVSGGDINIRGKDSSFRADITKSVNCAGKVEILPGGSMTSVYGRFNGIIENHGAIDLNTSDFQSQIRNRGIVNLSNANAFVSPNTNNDYALAIFTKHGGSVEHNTGCNLGLGDSFGENVVSNAFSANDVTMNVYVTAATYKLDGQGANRTGWILPLVYTDTGLSIQQGETIKVYGSTWGAEVTGNVDGSVSIGSGSGFYSGATFVFDSGQWKIIGTGIVR